MYWTAVFLVCTYFLLAMIVYRVLHYCMDDNFWIMLAAMFWPLGIPATVLWHATRWTVNRMEPAWNGLAQAIDRLMIYHVMARPIQRDRFGVLYRTTLRLGPGFSASRRQGRFVLVRDHKTKRAYRLGVPTQVRTAHEAVGWTAGLPIREELSFSNRFRGGEAEDYNPTVEA